MVCIPGYHILLGCHRLWQPLPSVVTVSFGCKGAGQTAASSLPVRERKAFFSEEATQRSGTCGSAICTSRGFHTAPSPMGLEISGQAGRKEVALALSHTSAPHELWVGHTSRGRGASVRYGNLTLSQGHVETVISPVLSKKKL